MKSTRIIFVMLVCLCQYSLSGLMAQADADLQSVPLAHFILG